MGKLMQNNMKFQRGFLGLSLTLYPGINNLKPDLVVLFKKNCPDFAYFTDPPPNTKDMRKPIEAPIVWLSADPVTGDARINFLKTLNQRPRTFTCPKVLFPPNNPSVKDQNGNVILTGQTTVSDEDYAKLTNPANMAQDAVHFRNCMAEGTIVFLSNT